MIIVKDERNEFTTKKCEECGIVAPGREVKAVGWITRESRGWYFLCFSCWKPHLHWKHNENGMVIMTPVSFEKYQTPTEATL